MYMLYMEAFMRKSECVKKSVLNPIKYMLFFFLDNALCYLIWCDSACRERGQDNSGK